MNPFGLRALERDKRNNAKHMPSDSPQARTVGSLGPPKEQRSKLVKYC
jgi:hypothetical protein